MNDNHIETIQEVHNEERNADRERDQVRNEESYDKAL